MSVGRSLSVLSFVTRPRPVCFVIALIVLLLGFQLLHWQLSFKRTYLRDYTGYKQPTDDDVDASLHNQHPVYHTPKDMPGLINPVVHYLWCGNKKFRFKDYLSVLSAMQTFRPLKLIFHYTHLPQTDDYNTFFKELKSTTPNLEMQELKPKPSCGSVDLLRTALGFLSEEGGVYVGENVILSLTLMDVPANTNVWFAFSNKTSEKTSGVVIAKTGLNTSLEDIISNRGAKPVCASIDTLNLSVHVKHCAVVDGIVYPRDIINAQTPFAELARAIFYGKRDPITPMQDSNDRIPRITHFVRFTSGKERIANHYQTEFPFTHFMNILSALYVAGFEHVYVHADKEPSGQWWSELRRENVTLVTAIKPDAVFQQPVKKVQHASDFARYLILYKYGGVYQDFDVTWISYVPDSLLSYPAVLGVDWAEKAEWPDSVNVGVMMCKPRALWFHHFIQTYSDYRESDWLYNSGLMSYRTYELYPHLAYLDRKLQILHYEGIYHPTWEKSYPRSMGDRRPSPPFSFQDVRSIHMTSPKLHPSISSPQGVRSGADKLAETGRMILKRSGRQGLLS